LNLGVSRNRFCDFLADPDSRSFSRFGAIIMQVAVLTVRADAACLSAVVYDRHAKAKADSWSLVGIAVARQWYIVRAAQLAAVHLTWLDTHKHTHAAWFQSFESNFQNERRRNGC
jgi:hypothetical protein